MDNQQVMTEFELGWLVCAVESEGCFSLRKQAKYMRLNGIRQKSHFYPMSELTSTDIAYSTQYRSLLDKVNIGHYDWEVAGTDKHRPQYRTKVRGLLRMKKFLEFIMPYLVSKGDRAQVLYDFIQLRLSKGGKTAPYGIEECNLFNKIREMNGYRTLRNPRDYTQDVLEYTSGKGRRYSPTLLEKARTEQKCLSQVA